MYLLSASQCIPILYKSPTEPIVKFCENFRIVDCRFLHFKFELKKHPLYIRPLSGERLLPKRAEPRSFPSSPRRGGCAISKILRSILNSRRRGGVQAQQKSVEF